MSEYKVKLQANIEQLFGVRTISGLEIVEADSAKEAIKKAKALVLDGLSTRGITEDGDGFKVMVTDVEKL